MRFVYVDEQFCKKDGIEFTAVCGSIFDSEDMHSLRAELFSGLDGILFESSASQNTINSIPILHGVDFLRGFDDEVKFDALGLVLKICRKYQASFFRLGVFDESIPFAQNVSQRVGFAIGNLTLCFGPDYPENYAIIQEMDRETLYNGIMSHDRSLANYYRLGQENISISLKRFIGHFVANKTDIGCQLADLAGYLALKADEPKSQFGYRLADLRSEYEDLYLMDEIIYMNDPTRTFRRVKRT